MVIGYGKIIDSLSAAREKQLPVYISWKRKNTCWTSFFIVWEDRMTRPNGHTKNVVVSIDVFDVNGHRCRWRGTLIAGRHAFVVVSWHVQNVSVRTDLAGEAQDSACT